MEEEDLEEMYINGVWRPNLAITGIDGSPKIDQAGSALQPFTNLKLSIRLSPTQDADTIFTQISELLTKDVPFNYKVTLHGVQTGSGWCMQDLEPNLLESIHKASKAFYAEKECATFGEGGAIPFLKELQTKFPSTQVFTFGTGGPNSNSHAPNEAINLAYTKGLTCSVAHILADIGSFNK